MNEINEEIFNIENTDINIFEAIITYCQMINSLTELQANYEVNSEDWLKLERKLVEIECSLFNDVLELDLEIVEIIFQQLPIIPIIGLHLHKYFNNYKFETEINTLSDTAKKFIELMYSQWADEREKKRNYCK